MADNLALRTGTQGSSFTLATDDVGGFHYQRVRSAPDRQKFTITPVISTGIYASGDCLGPLQTIASASSAAGLGGYIESIVVVDKTQSQRAAFDIVLYSATVTTAADNAAFQMSDADALNVVGIISVIAADYNTAWPGTPLNSIAFKPDTKVASNDPRMRIPYTCAATSLFVQLVVRGTPTYTATDSIVVSFNCVLD